MIFPQPSELHLWHTSLEEGLYQDNYLQLLDEQEKRRASQFKFELHRKRFILAHAGLRSILSLYLNLRPQNIHILRTPKGKPFLENTELQFNLSHSKELALYTFTLDSVVGVDLEKIRSSYNDALAKRFFSPEEYEQLSNLPSEQKRIEFYRIWAGKEAVVKALGEGLGFSLPSFTIPSHAKTKEVLLKIKSSPQIWYLENVDIFPGYQAAFATNKMITRLSCFEWPLKEKK